MPIKIYINLSFTKACLLEFEKHPFFLHVLYPVFYPLLLLLLRFWCPLMLPFTIFLLRWFHLFQLRCTLYFSKLLVQFYHSYPLVIQLLLAHRLYHTCYRLLQQVWLLYVLLFILFDQFVDTLVCEDTWKGDNLSAEILCELRIIVAFALVFYLWCGLKKRVHAFFFLIFDSLPSRTIKRFVCCFIVQAFIHVCDLQVPPTTWFLIRIYFFLIIIMEPFGTVGNLDFQVRACG